MMDSSNAVILRYALYVRHPPEIMHINSTPFYQHTSDIYMTEAPMKRLYRSCKDRIIAGVCGGIGEYFDVDPNIIRIIWLLVGITGTGIIAYILAWVIIPEEPPQTPTPAEPGTAAV
jgi:phage shock protein C